MRNRRTTRELGKLSEELIAFAEREAPVTVRQAFYFAVSNQLIEKDEKEYGVIQRLLVQLRESGDIAYEDIIDQSRRIRKPNTFRGPADVLRAVAGSYRRNIWDDQKVNLQIWLEKEALAAVFEEVTEEYDVPLFATKGFASRSFLHKAAKMIKASDKQTIIRYFGDRDPSGVEIPNTIERTLWVEFGCTSIDFEVAGVTEDQISEYNLVTRPTKNSDTRAKHFHGDSVELDAIPPSTLRGLVRGKIVEHIDQRKLRRTRTLQEKERDAFENLAAAFSQGRIDLAGLSRL